MASCPNGTGLFLGEDQTLKEERGFLGRSERSRRGAVLMVPVWLLWFPCPGCDSAGLCFEFSLWRADRARSFHSL